jgi:hypothetical protein
MHDALVEMCQSGISNLIAGIISGIISGVLVTQFYKRKEQKDYIFDFWMKYICDVLDECDIHFPAERIENLKDLGGLKGKFGQAIQAIEDIRYPVGEDYTMSDKYSELSDYAIVALKELLKWKQEKP